jgi:hypothetical protein
VPTDGAFKCTITTGRSGVGPPIGGGPCGSCPGIAGAGPEPGSPDPAGGPLLVARAGAPAVVPIALAWASVIEDGRIGACGPGGVFGGMKAISRSVNWIAMCDCSCRS